MSSTAALYYNFERWATTTTKGGGRQKIEILFRNERHFPSLPQHIHTPRKKTLWQKLKFQGVSISSLLKIETKNKFKKKNKKQQLSLSRKCRIFFYQIGNRPTRNGEGGGWTANAAAPNAKTRLDKKLFRACKDASFYNVATLPTTT